MDCALRTFFIEAYWLLRLGTVGIKPPWKFLQLYFICKDITSILFYGNNYNFGQSTYYRAAWFMKLCLIHISRFHCQHHSSIYIFNHSTYPFMTYLKIKFAQSSNERMETALNNVRYLRCVKLVPDLRMSFKFLLPKEAFTSMFFGPDTEE